MNNNFDYVKKPKTLIAIRFLLFSLITISVFMGFIFINRNNLPINLNLLFILAIFIFFIILSYIYQIVAKKKLNSDNDLPIFIKKIIKVFLMTVFTILFIKSFGAAGFWILIYNFLMPNITVGLVFIFAILIQFIIQDTLIATIFAVPILLFPFNFFDNNITYIDLGSIVSGIVIGNILVKCSNINNLIKYRNLEIFKRTLFDIFKIIFSAIIIGLVLYFILGNNNNFWNNTLDTNISKTKLFVNLIPLLFLILMFIFQIDSLIILPIIIFAQSITGLAQNLFLAENNYNIFSLLLFNQFRVDDNLWFNYFNSICQALECFFSLLIILWFKRVYQEIIPNFKISNSWAEFSTQHDHKYKRYFAINFLIDLANYKSSSKEILNSMPNLNKELIDTVSIYDCLYLIASFFLTFSFENIWIMQWASNVFMTSLINIYFMLIKGIWSGYIIIFLCLILIIFPIIQDFYFKNWFGNLFNNLKIFKKSSKFLFKKTKKTKKKHSGG